MPFANVLTGLRCSVSRISFAHASTAVSSSELGDMRPYCLRFALAVGLLLSIWPPAFFFVIVFFIGWGI
jgi:hypothetical protein